MVDFILASKRNYVSLSLFEKLKKNYNFIFVENTVDLKNNLYKNNSKKIFFLHWSHIVCKEIYNEYECINIHTSCLPNGRGGSPLQNQILDNIVISRVNALRMSDDGLDAGPIYCSQEITLQGNLTDIWHMISYVSYNLITKIIDDNIIPKEQVHGDVICYKRRKDNKIPFDSNDLLKLYDFIRMLDSEEYPNPYIEIGNFRLEFNRANFNGEKIHSDVIITKL